MSYGHVAQRVEFLASGCPVRLAGGSVDVAVKNHPLTERKIMMGKSGLSLYGDLPFG
tara:strand:+ start:18 stop:188 length:171 start_codon:yes stop_codon:yes gene_type:complete